MENTPKTLADFNPEIAKLPIELQQEFHNRYTQKPEAWYLALTAGECLRIIALENVEKERVRLKEEKKLQRKKAEAERLEKLKQAKLKRAEARKRSQKRQRSRPAMYMLGLIKNSIKKSGKSAGKRKKGPASGKLRLTTQQQLQAWKKLYQQEFNLDISKDIDNLYIPEKLEGFNWLILVHKSLKPNQIYNKLASKFNCYKYRDNLDEITITADRPDTEIYAIWVKDTIEADPNLQNLSANQIAEQGINSITLEERLLLELFYWRNEKKHLDLDNWTLVAGSRDPDGRVPHVHWHRDDRGLDVRWYFASSAYGDLRCRQAIS